MKGKQFKILFCIGIRARAYSEKCQIDTKNGLSCSFFSNSFRFIEDYSETVFEFHERLGVVVVDGEGAAIGVKEVVTEDGVQLIVEGIVGT